MAVDVRAKVFCNLGPLISGNLSDEPLTIGQGLIRCRGQLVVKGLIAPAIGSVVTLGYEKGGRIARLPRVVRVIGSFADPFRNVTTVSVGDKLVLLADKRSYVAPAPEPPPTTAELNEEFVTAAPYPDAGQSIQPTTTRSWNGACWQTKPTAPEEQSGLSALFPFNDGFRFETVLQSQTVSAAEEWANATLKDFATAKPSLSAAFIAYKCLAGLGIGAASMPLTNTYNDGEFDLSEGYVSVLEKLISSESKVGYLDETEHLVVETILADAPGFGVVVSEDSIIDVGPLNIGTPPADEVRVLTNNTKNAETKALAANEAPVANDFRLLGGGRYNDTTFALSDSELLNNGFDPDYFEQILLNSRTRLSVAEVTAGQGCTINRLSFITNVTPTPDFEGVGSVSYTLTDGVNTSNSATCYFVIEARPGANADASLIEAPVKESAAEAKQVEEESGLPLQNAQDPEKEEEQRATRTRNWEFEENVGQEKIVAINYEDELGEKQVQYYSYNPYTQTRTFYDEYDRKTESYTYQEGLTAEVAGNIVKAQLEARAVDNGGEGISWYTKESCYYYTQEKEEVLSDEEVASDFGKAYEDSKAREKQAWEDAMEKNRIANQGETGALQTNGTNCPIDFNPPENPADEDTYVYDGMNFVYDNRRGWVHEKGNYAPVAESYLSNIYTKDLTDRVVSRRKSLISYMTQQVVERYGPLREVLGGLSLPFDADYYYMPSITNVKTDRTLITYDVDWEGGKTKTTTENWCLACNTIQGQQLIKQLCDDLDGSLEEDRPFLLSEIISTAMEWVYLGAEVQIRTDREYGVQQRPSLYDREWSEVIKGDSPDPDVFGDFSVIDRNASSPNQVVSVEQGEPGGNLAQDRTVTMTVTPPYTTGPKRALELGEELSALYEESRAQQQALTYGRAVNAVARGNRYGMALQLGIESVPTKPLSWMYVRIGGTAAGYRINGVSYVFNETGLLCNVDALFWGGVGGTGTPWFPLAQGITTLPELPEVSTDEVVLANSMPTPEGFDASAPGNVWETLPYLEEGTYGEGMEPAALVPAVRESLRCVAAVRPRLFVRRFDYSLELPQRTATLVLSAELTAARVKLLDADAGALTATGQAAALVRRFRLPAAATSFAATGMSSGYVFTRQIGTNAGNFTATGQEATLIALPRILGDAGTFIGTGQSANLIYNRLPFGVDAGAYGITGQDTKLLFINYIIKAEAASLAVTGQTSNLVPTRTLPAASGSFALTGMAAQLPYANSAAQVIFYSGNGGSTRTITGAGFEPGFVATKGRNAGVPHAWHDLARGKNTAGYLWVRAGEAAAEEVPDTSSTVSTRGLQDFTSDGWSMNGSSIVNGSGINYFALCLKKGSATSSNTSGSITTQVSAQTSLEYSAFTYTGVGSTDKTIGHGLSGAPDMVIIKRRTATTNSAWVGGPAIGDNYYLSFNTNAVRVNSTSYFQSFDSSTVSIGSQLTQNAVTYCGWAFKSQSGKSDIGSFTGTGSSTYSVTLGYTPQMVMIKNITSTTGDWFVFYMPTGGTGYAKQLRFNTTATEGTSTTVQMTADGFSVNTGGPGNVSGGATSALYWALK